VAQLVELLRCKAEGRGYYSLWGYCDFPLILLAVLWPCGRLIL